jgi:hypothetical protein
MIPDGNDGTKEIEMTKHVNIQVSYSDGSVETYVHAQSTAQSVIDRYEREVAQPDTRWGWYPTAIRVY